MLPQIVQEGEVSYLLKDIVEQYVEAVVVPVLDKLDVEGGYAASVSSGRGDKLFA